MLYFMEELKTSQHFSNVLSETCYVPQTSANISELCCLPCSYYTCTFSSFLSLSFAINVKNARSKEKSVLIHTHSVHLSFVRHKQEQGGQY